jgi:hypothetical protein
VYDKAAALTDKKMALKFTLNQSQIFRFPLIANISRHLDTSYTNVERPHLSSDKKAREER